MKWERIRIRPGAAFDSLMLSITKLTTICMGMIITKALSVSLSLTEYGTYSQALMIVNVTVSIIMFGLLDALNFYYNSLSDGTRQQYVNTIFYIESTIGIVAGIVLILFRSVVIQYFNNQSLGILILIISFKPLFENCLSLYQVMYISVGRAKLVSIRNFFISVIKLMSVIVGIRIHSLYIIFIILVVFDVVQLALFSSFFSKNYFKINPFKSVLTKVKPILCYSLPMGIYLVTNTLTRTLDKLVISKLAGTEQLAVYANCAKTLPFDIITSSIITIIVPYIIKYLREKDYSKVKTLYSSYLKLGAYSVWVLGFGSLITSKQLINLLYSPEYLVGNSVFIIYIIDTMVRFAGMHLILTGNGNTKSLMVYSLMSLFCNTILNIVLFNLLGFIGPATATLVVAILYVVLITRKSLSIIQCRIGELIRVKRLLLFIFELLISGIALYALNRHLLNSNINQYICLFLTFGLYVTINLFINYKSILNALKQLNQYRINNTTSV
jgi:O-antigen/teichoic acid export membrane protein